MWVGYGENKNLESGHEGNLISPAGAPNHQIAQSGFQDSCSDVTDNHMTSKAGSSRSHQFGFLISRRLRAIKLCGNEASLATASTNGICQLNPPQNIPITHLSLGFILRKCFDLRVSRLRLGSVRAWLITQIRSDRDILYLTLANTLILHKYINIRSNKWFTFSDSKRFRPTTFIKVIDGRLSYLS